MAGVNTRSSACAVCKVKLRSHDDAIICARCQKRHHVECAGVDMDEYLRIRESGALNSWTCAACCDLTSLGDVSGGGESKVIVGDDVGGKCCCSECPELRLEIGKLREMIDLQSKQIALLCDGFQVHISEIKATIDEKFKFFPSTDITVNAANLSHNSISTPPPPQDTINRQKGNVVSYANSVAKVNKQISKAVSSFSADKGKVVNSGVNELPVKTADFVGPNKVSENVNTDIATDKDEDFIEVNRRRRRRTDITVGTGTAGDGFSGVVKRAWLYVGRVQRGTSAENVRRYLVGKCPSVDFLVDTLRSDEGGCSFKVGFEFSKLGDVTKPDIWPENVIVRKFNFVQRLFREKNGHFGRRETDSAAKSLPSEHTEP